MDIGEYNVYEMELKNNKGLKVDCTYEDVSIISTIVDNKIAPHVISILFCLDIFSSFFGFYYIILIVVRSTTFRWNFVT